MSKKSNDNGKAAELKVQNMAKSYLGTLAYVMPHREWFDPDEKSGVHKLDITLRDLNRKYYIAISVRSQKDSGTTDEKLEPERTRLDRLGKNNTLFKKLFLVIVGKGAREHSVNKSKKRDSQKIKTLYFEELEDLFKNGTIGKILRLQTVATTI